MAEARGGEIDDKQATKRMVIYLIFLFFSLHSLFFRKGSTKQWLVYSC